MPPRCVCRWPSAARCKAGVDTLPDMPNIHHPDFDELRKQPGFVCHRARVSRQTGSDRLGLSLWELPPSQAAYPYHYHLGEEELVIVLSGQPLLRTPAGTRRLPEGEIVSFPRGEQGAHQLFNDTPDTIRFLAFSTSGEPDIVIYPDSHKIAAAERRRGTQGLHAVFRMDSTVDYYTDEVPPQA